MVCSLGECLGGFNCGVGDGVGGGKRGVRFEAVSEMPRPYVNVVLQATEHTRFLKNSLTRRGDAPNKLLNLLEQLLHKIKAKRRREMSKNQEFFDHFKKFCEFNHSKSSQS